MESMENEQYVVLINLGAREETVDMAKLFPEFKGTAKFVAGGFNTFYTTEYVLYCIKLIFNIINGNMAYMVNDSISAIL